MELEKHCTFKPLLVTSVSPSKESTEDVFHRLSAPKKEGAISPSATLSRPEGCTFSPEITSKAYAITYK